MLGGSTHRRPARRARTLAVLTALFALLVSTGAVASPSGPPGHNGGAQGTPAAEVIPDSYIVLLDSEHPSAVARDHARRHGVRVDRVYQAALQGYAATIPEPALPAIQRDPRVLVVEPNIRMEAFSADEPIIPTGIKRSAIEPYLDGGDGTYDSYGEAPAVAVLDTGIEVDRDELNVVGRVDCMDVYEVTWGNPRNRGVFGDCVTERDSEVVADDEDGHGTHVAGTIGASGAILGVAPGVPLYAVQVLGPDGGTMAGVAAGVDWVVAAKEQNDANIGVINMSLGGSGTYETMDTAIANAAAAGIVTVVAAGNADADAAGYTPANSPAAITVGALSDLDGQPGGDAPYEGPCWTAGCPEDDARAPFSNYGDTVDLAAPGVFIESTVPGGYDEYSGTSMAAPHVAGAALLALHDQEVEPDALLDHLLEEWTVTPQDDAGYEPTPTKPIGPLLYLGEDGNAGEGGGDDTANGDEGTDDSADDGNGDGSTDDGNGDGNGDGTEDGNGDDSAGQSYSLEGVYTGNRQWFRAEVTFTVTGGDDVADITVTGDWSGAINQTGVSCTTDASGSCTIEGRARQSDADSATFTVKSTSPDIPAKSETDESVSSKG